MGMYTELDAAFDLPNLTDIDVKIIQYMLDEGPELEESELPNHPLFKTDRWDFMLYSGSYYFRGKPCYVFRYDDIAKTHFLTVRCNLKNYKDEIHEFLDWIYPKSEHEGFVGYYRYEESDDPTLIYFTDDGIEYKNVA